MILFKHRDKCSRRQDPEGRIPPPDKRLLVTDSSGPRVYDRLIVCQNMAGSNRLVNMVKDVLLACFHLSQIAVIDDTQPLLVLMDAVAGHHRPVTAEIRRFARLIVIDTRLYTDTSIPAHTVLKLLQPSGQILIIRHQNEMVRPHAGQQTVRPVDTDNLRNLAEKFIPLAEAICLIVGGKTLHIQKDKSRPFCVIDDILQKVFGCRDKERDVRQTSHRI